jgi:predicted Fe-S protein YdhL (DUF1289 family)
MSAKETKGNIQVGESLLIAKCTWSQEDDICDGCRRSNLECSGAVFASPERPNVSRARSQRDQLPIVLPTLSPTLPQRFHGVRVSDIANLIELHQPHLSIIEVFAEVARQLQLDVREEIQ